MQIVEALFNGLSDINSVHARLLGNGQRNRRAGSFLAEFAGKDRLVGDVRLLLNIGHIGQIHQPAFIFADNQLAEFFAGLQEAAGLNLNDLIILHQRLVIAPGVGTEQRVAYIIESQAVAVHARRVELNLDHAVVTPQGVNITGAGNAF